MWMVGSGAPCGENHKYDYRHRLISAHAILPTRGESPLGDTRSAADALRMVGSCRSMGGVAGPRTSTGPARTDGESAPPACHRTRSSVHCLTGTHHTELESSNRCWTNEEKIATMENTTSRQWWSSGVYDFISLGALNITKF